MKFVAFLPLAALAAFAASTTAAQRTVWDGVYSAEQVARGKKGYNAQCARCHGDNLLGGEESPALVDKDFMKGWTGKSVGELVEVTVDTMPSDGPGKLSRKLCTDIVAYMLSLNGFPAGTAELPSDAATLKQIFIQPKK
jgi:mono/diheme cytochrome c family protein